MRFLLTLISFFLIFTCTGNTGRIPQDRIGVFLTEYIDGKPSGSIMKLEINILELNKVVKWYLTQTMVHTVDNDKSSWLQVINASSEEKSDWPFLRNIDWHPGKSLYCVFYPGGGSQKIQLKVEKIDVGWNVSGVGKVKGPLTLGKYELWEWKGSREVKLKFNKLYLESFYEN